MNALALSPEKTTLWACETPGTSDLPPPCLHPNPATGKSGTMAWKQAGFGEKAERPF